MTAALRDPNPVLFIENVKLYGQKPKFLPKSTQFRSARREFCILEAM
jgi:pyruvate/2-oxoglutarate/acetoin dehydrogenase E1 component